MTPLDRISQLTDENAQLRAERARVTEERDEVSGKLNRGIEAADFRERDLRARVADLEADASLHWITEEELRQSRARVAELEAALREEKRIHPEDFQQGDFRERALALARAESATPTKHPDTERLDAIEDGGLDVFESHGEWYVGAAEPCRTLRAALDAARKQGGAA